MTNWLLEFYSNGAGIFYLTVVADSYEAAKAAGEIAGANMGYSFRFSNVVTELV